MSHRTAVVFAGVNTALALAMLVLALSFPAGERVWPLLVGAGALLVAGGALWQERRAR